MANVRKRISELTALESASLDTTIVGVDGGTTYKIELDTLADAVTSRVNILDRDRLTSLESVTSSFETKGRSVISSSAQITTLGFVSTSVDITSLNSFTSSQNTLNTAFTNGINARLQTSSFNDFSTSVDSRIIAATNEQNLTHLVNTSSFNEYTASQSTSSLVDRLNSIENVSGSWITKSETGSYAITGSNLFRGNQTISGSVSILIPGGTATGTNENPTPNNIFWSYPSLDTNTSNVQIGWTAVVQGGGTYTVTNVELDTPYAPFISITLSEPSLTLGYRVRVDFSKDPKLWQFNNDGTLTGLPSGLISGSSQLTSSYDSRYVISGSVGATPLGTISGSAQITAFGFISSSQTIDTASLVTTSSFNSYTASISTASLVTSISNLNSATSSYLTSLSGAISSSSQLTSSFDTRYAISASFVSSSNVASIQTITSASYAALTPVSGTLYIIIG